MGETITLYCFSHAGGLVSTYRSWIAALSPMVVVCPVPVPGHDFAAGSPLHRRMQPLVADLRAALEPRISAPCAFYGHSMGALVAFEVVRELRRAGVAEPRHLFVSGHDAPRLPRRRPDSHRLPDGALVERVRALGGTAGEILENAELAELLLPIVRADFEVCETYAYAQEPPLECPITVLGGVSDPETTLSGLAAWASETRGRVALREFPGGHFFVQTCEPLVLEEIRRQLEVAVDSSSSDDAARLDREETVRGSGLRADTRM